MANEVEMQQIHDFLEECVNEAKTFYLTRVDNDVPASRPVLFHMLCNRIEYFGVDKHKDVLSKSKLIHLFKFLVVRVQNGSASVVLPCLMTLQCFLMKRYQTMPFLANLYNEETGKTLGIFRLEQAQAQFYVNMM